MVKKNKCATFLTFLIGVMRKGMFAEKTHHTNEKQPRIPKVLSSRGTRRKSIKKT